MVPRDKAALQHFREATPMGKPGPQTQAKRRREQMKREKREAKAEKKALRKAQKKLEQAGGAPPAEVEPFGNPNAHVESPDE